MQKRHLLRVISVPCFCLAAVMAQSTPPQSRPKTGNPTNEKVLGLTLPNSLVVEGRDIKLAPLSVGQKFEQVGKNFFNPFTFLAAGVQAGINQATDIHHDYGQGGEGYAKRFGANIADTASAQFFGIGVYPSIFRTDPRYYRVGDGGFMSRTSYALTRVLVTRTDSGRHVFNAPEILASATSSAISRAYYPENERNFGDFAYQMGSRIAFDAAFNLVKEFWPDVRSHLFGHGK
jgi:hypothetical protein